MVRDESLRKDMLEAVRSGDVVRVSRLLDSNPELANQDMSLGTTPLHYAVMDNHLDVVRLLLDRGADIDAKNDRGFTALNYAAYEGLRAAGELLLERGAHKCDLDGSGMAPIHAAASQGKTGFVKLLLAQPFSDIDQRDARNMTPLHYAAVGCHVETADLLLSCGADPNAVANDGGTPMDWAWYRRNNTVILTLLHSYGGSRKSASR